MLQSALLQRGEHAVHVCQKQVGGADKLDVQRRIEHIRRGHALMDEARVRSDELGQMGQECDDVMLRLALDFVDALDVEFRRSALFPDGAGSFLRDHTDLRQRVARMRLDLEPDAELGFGRPDGDHFRPRIARDHA